jgi:hypothetical protein
MGMTAESSVLIAQFCEISRRATLFELSVRLLADDVPALSPFALDAELRELVNRLVEYFYGDLGDEERSLLLWCGATFERLVEAWETDLRPAQLGEKLGVREVAKMGRRFAEAVQVLSQVQTE